MTIKSGQVYQKDEIESAYLDYVNNQLLEEDRLYYKDAQNNKYKRTEYDNVIALHNLIAGIKGNADKTEKFIKALYNENLDMSKAAKDVLGSDCSAGKQEVNAPVTDDDSNSVLEGISINQLQCLINMLIAANKGIEDVDLPYIASVRKHWFYDDINFTKSRNNNGNGVYNTAAKATKKLEYSTTDDDDPLNKLGITMNATLTAKNEEGIYYQVNEPITSGPNANIVKLFQGKYYRYDGTVETARKIAMAKLFDKEVFIKTYYFEGDTYQLTDQDQSNYENGKLPQKETPKFGSASDTLTAFSILKNVHTSASDSVYRMLKELATSDKIENHLEEGSLNEDLRKVLIWPFENGEGTASKDDNNYGIDITDVEGMQVLAPGDAEVVSTSGDSITLKFGVLSDDIVQLLEYIYKKDFYDINPNIVNGMTMTIKGISPSASGTVTRGQAIGTASEKVNIVMQHIDKSLVGEENTTTDDDVEDYIGQDYTKAKEEEYRARKERAKGVAGEDADIISNTYVEYRNDLNNSNVSAGGNGIYVDYHPNGEKEIPEEVSDNQMHEIYAIIAAEDDKSYEGALGVISTAYNRIYGKRKVEWKSFGSSIYEQLTCDNQYKGYKSKRYYAFMNNEVKIPDYVINAVDDCMRSGKINTAFDSLNAKREDADSTIRNNKGNTPESLKKNGYDPNSTRYIRQIGANWFYNADGSPEYYRELEGTDIFNQEASGNMMISAKKLHDYMAENGFTYNNKYAKPVPLGKEKVTDCSHFVSLVLYDYGFRDISSQLSTNTLPEYFSSHSDSFAKVYDAKDSGFTHSAKGLGLQPGDICFIGTSGDVPSGKTGHVQIFAGYDSNGDATWYNCGSDRAIRAKGPQTYSGLGSKGIVNVYRVIK